MPAAITLTRPAFTNNDTIDAAAFNDVTATGGTVPDASTSAAGVVELAGDGETAPNVVVQGNDSRLHTHANKPSLDKISEATGLPTWDGNPWPGSVGSGDMHRATYDPDTDGVIAIGQGGTGATTAPAALAALGAVADSDVRLSNARPPTAHTHNAPDVRGLPIDPRDYGATVNDSAVDSTAALQLAITAAIAQGRPLAIDGVYYCKTFPATSASYISGAADTLVTALVADGSLTMLGYGRRGKIVFGGSVSGETWAVGMKVQNGDCLLDGVAFEFTKVSTTQGAEIIHVRGGDTFEARGCSFKNGFAHIEVFGERLLVRVGPDNLFDARITTEYGYGVMALDAPAVHHWQIRGNTFLGNNSTTIGADAILLNQDNVSGLLGSYTPANTYSVAIEGNQFKDYVSNGAAVSGAISVAGPFRNLLIAGNQANNCKVGAHVEWTVVNGVIPRSTPCRNYAVRGNEFLDVKIGVRVSMGDSGDFSTLDYQYPHRMVLIDGNTIYIRPTGGDGDDACGIASTFGWAKITNNTLVFADDVMLADASKRGFGIYSQRCNLIAEHNLVLNFKYGIGFAGGFQATQHRRLHGNEYHQCASSYYFDEQTGRMGALTIDGNKHVGCGLLATFTNNPTTNRIYVTQETIAGQLMIDQGWIGSAATFVPYGIVASSTTLQAPTNDVNDFYSPNFNKIGVLTGHRMRFASAAGEAWAERVATEAGNIIAMGSVTVATTNGSKLIILAAAVPDTLNPGVIVTVTAAGITRAIVTFIDRQNRVVKVSEAATSTQASTPAALPQVASYDVNQRTGGYTAVTHNSGTYSIPNAATRWFEITGNRSAYAEFSFSNTGAVKGDTFYLHFNNYTDGGGGDFAVYANAVLLAGFAGTMDALITMKFTGTVWKLLQMDKEFSA